MESQPTSPIKISYDEPSPMKVTQSTPDSDKLLLTPSGRRNKMRIEGHRGFGRHEPENTLQAFTVAQDEELDGIELDVWLTKDNAVVVIHSKIVEGVDGYVFFDDGSKKLVYEMTLKEIRSQRVLNGFIVPRLDEVLRLAKDKTCLNIEFKGTDLRAAEEVLKICRAHQMLDQVQFSSFNWKFCEALDVARESLKIQQRQPFGFLTEELTLAETEIQLAEAFLLGKADDGVTFDWDMIHKNVEDFKIVARTVITKGFKVKVFIPYSHTEIHADYDVMESIEVDTVITNEPFLLKRYYESRVIKAY